MNPNAENFGKKPQFLLALSMLICKYTKYANKPYFENRQIGPLVLHPVDPIGGAGSAKKHQLLRTSRGLGYYPFRTVRFRTHS